MDILDRYLGYEAWIFRYFVERCRELTPTQLHEPFDIGHGTVHRWEVQHMLQRLGLSNLLEGDVLGYEYLSNSDS